MKMKMKFIPKINEWCWNTEEKMLIKITYIYNIKGFEDEYLYLSQFSDNEKKGFFSLSSFEQLTETVPSFLK